MSIVPSLEFLLLLSVACQCKMVDGFTERHLQWQYKEKLWRKIEPISFQCFLRLFIIMIYDLQTLNVKLKVINVLMKISVGYYDGGK